MVMESAHAYEMKKRECMIEWLETRTHCLISNWFVVIVIGYANSGKNWFLRYPSKMKHTVMNENRGKVAQPFFFLNIMI